MTIPSTFDTPPLRIMPVGDSITVGYTDNPEWTHPFAFGYRCGLALRMQDALVRTVFETAPDVRLIVAQLPPKSAYDPHLTDLNRWIRDELVPAAAQRGHRISTVDLYTPFLRIPDDPESIDPSRFSNGINHPTNAMYDVLAERWFREIEGMISNGNLKPIP